MVALSVSTSAMISPISTLSPWRIFHFNNVPSVIVSESLGILIRVGMAVKKC